MTSVILLLVSILVVLVVALGAMVYFVHHSMEDMDNHIRQELHRFSQEKSDTAQLLTEIAALRVQLAAVLSAPRNQPTASGGAGPGVMPPIAPPGHPPEPVAAEDFSTEPRPPVPSTNEQALLAMDL